MFVLFLSTNPYTKYPFQVESFLERLRPRGGLAMLQLIGIHNQQNLYDFKHGFVRPGGKFIAKDEQGNMVAMDETPRKLTRNVRRFIEKD